MTSCSESKRNPVTLSTVVVNDGERALEWYSRALGGKVTEKYKYDKGGIMHAIIATDYGLKLSLEDHNSKEHKHFVHPSSADKSDNNNLPPTYIYVTIPKDHGVTADKAVELMKKEGAEVVEEPVDKFYGHRVGKVVDIWGVSWTFAHEIDVKQTETQASK